MTPEAMAALHAQVFRTPRPWSADEFAGLLQNPHVFFCGGPEGFLLGQALAGEAEILTLAVPPQARRQGRGRALVAGFLTEARERGATTAFLEVAIDNAAALALYRTTGFAEAGRRRGYFLTPDGKGIDALVLRCALATPLDPAASSLVRPDF